MGFISVASVFYSSLSLFSLLFPFECSLNFVLILRQSQVIHTYIYINVYVRLNAFESFTTSKCGIVIRFSHDCYVNSMHCLLHWFILEQSTVLASDWESHGSKFFIENLTSRINFWFQILTVKCYMTAKIESDLNFTRTQTCLLHRVKHVCVCVCVTIVSAVNKTCGHKIYSSAHTPTCAMLKCSAWFICQSIQSNESKIQIPFDNKKNKNKNKTTNKRVNERADSQWILKYKF